MSHPFVFLHGLTFDARMWQPVLAELAPEERALALDLPGHGGAPALPSHRPERIADAIHTAVRAAGFDAPVMVGHSLGVLAATVYATRHPVAGIVNVDTPVRPAPFAQLIHALAPRLRSGAFPQVWRRLRASMHAERLPGDMRALLAAGDEVPPSLVLSYWQPLLDGPPEHAVAWTDGVLDAIQDVPYLALYGGDFDEAEQAWLHTRLPGAEIVVWPVEHHFPHLADPAAFAGLLRSFAHAARPPCVVGA